MTATKYKKSCIFVINYTDRVGDVHRLPKHLSTHSFGFMSALLLSDRICRITNPRVSHVLSRLCFRFICTIQFGCGINGLVPFKQLQHVILYFIFGNGNSDTAEETFAEQQLLMNAVNGDISCRNNVLRINSIFMYYWKSTQNINL